MLFPSKTDALFGDFDYADYYPGRAILLRLGEILVIAVLNDACGALNVLSEDLKKITGPLSSLQCRELLAHFAYANALLKSRPTFYTHCVRGMEALTISADMPKLLETGDFVPSDFGEILHSVLSSCIDMVPFPEPEQAREHIRKGRWTFLFDKNGQFVKDSS